MTAEWSLEDPLSPPLLLHITFSHAPRLWSWISWLGVHITATTNVAEPVMVTGTIRVTVTAASNGKSSTVKVPLRVRVTSTPKRSKRIAWDVAHNLQFPRDGFVPKDDLSASARELDRHGDHPYTNFRHLLLWLQQHGYCVETVGAQFNTSLYGVLFLVDSEAEFSKDYRQRIHASVSEEGLALVVLAEWYDAEVANSLKFRHETRQMIPVVSGGSNVPALNQLLLPFGIVLRERGGVYSGPQFASGVVIDEVLTGTQLRFQKLVAYGSGQEHSLPVLAATTWGHGSVVVYGDTGCWDTASPLTMACSALMTHILHFAAGVSDLPATWQQPF
jgi:hypothetical protein